MKYLNDTINRVGFVDLYRMLSLEKIHTFPTYVQQLQIVHTRPQGNTKY